MIDEQYVKRVKAFIDSLEYRWESKKISNEKAMNIATGYIQSLAKVSSTSSKISDLIQQLVDLMVKIRSENKAVYIIRTTNLTENKQVACADESLLHKCITRLQTGTMYEVSKLQICRTTADVDKRFDESMEISNT